jgi:hypothetical protein
MFFWKAWRNNMNKNIGICVDMQSESQRLLAKQVCDYLQEKTDKNPVVFYDTSGPVSFDFKTSVLNIEQLWGFCGIVLNTSLKMIKRIANKTSEIKSYYVPTTENHIDPVFLMSINDDFTILAQSGEIEERIKRIIGNNVKIKVFDGVENLVRGLT